MARSAVRLTGLIDLEPHFDLFRDAPDLAAELQRERPELHELAEAQRAELPIANTCGEFTEERFVRPRYHHRAFYRSPGDLRRADELGRLPDSAGVLAIKGTEPAAFDFAASVAALASSFIKLHSTVEHFALHERKVPLAVSFAEVEEEVAMALEVQRAHLRCYGTLARLPVPVSSFRWSAKLAHAVERAVMPHVSTRAFEQVRSQFADGFGVYCYAYPTLPIRAGHFARTMQAGPLARGWLDELESRCAPFEIIDGWIRGFVRLLALGYFPCSMGNLGFAGVGRGLGQLCNPNNSVVDGGFVDLGSLMKIDDVRDQRGFQLTIELCLRELTGSVRMFLLGQEFPPAERGVHDVYYGSVDRYLLDRLREAMKTEARPAATIAPRIAAFFSPMPDVLRGMLADDRTFYAPPPNVDMPRRQS